MSQTPSLRTVGLVALGITLGLGLAGYLRRAGATVDNGLLSQINAQAQAGTLQVNLDVTVLSRAAASRLYEVVWTVAHPAWLRQGDTLLREIPAGESERFGVVESTPPFAPGDSLVVKLELFSQALDGGGRILDDATEFRVVAV